MEWGCNRQSDHTLNDISSVLVSFLCVQSAAVPVEERDLIGSSSLGTKVKQACRGLCAEFVNIKLEGRILAYYARSCAHLVGRER